MAGQTDLMIAPTWSSCFPETGEKTPTMTTFLIPRSNRNHWYQQIPPGECENARTSELLFNTRREIWDILATYIM